MGGETNLGRVLETIVKRARALVEARSLVVLLADGDELIVAATAGEVDRAARGRKIPAEDWTSGRLLHALEAERVADVSTRLRISPGDLGVEAAAAMVVPLRFRGQPLGLIATFDRLTEGPEFTAEDERLLLAFAASAATAVATAQSVTEDRLRHSIEASERERGRWARELHDETLQALGAMRMGLSSALRGGTDAMDNAVRHTVGQLGDEIDKIRALITELRPAALDQIGLYAALEALVLHAEKTQGLDLQTEIDLSYPAGRTSDRLEPELENTVYRVVQESLTNIAKHARAEQVRLRVIENDADETISVAIEDDGVGFDPDKASEGFGLIGIRERAEMAGGRMEIASSPGSGTRLNVSIPVARRREAERGAA